MLAPEIVRHQAYDHRADMFSAGVVLYYMLAGEYPFDHIVEERIIHNISLCQFSL